MSREQIKRGSILRPKDVCQVLNISNATYWRWVKNGNLPQPIRLGPNTVGTFERDLFAVIDARTEKRTSGRT